MAVASAALAGAAIDAATASAYAAPSDNYDPPPYYSPDDY
jgi:hypothetical protein